MRPPPPAGGGGGGLGRAQFAPSRLAQAVCILNVLVCFSVVCLYLLTDEVGDDGRSLLSSNWDRGGLSAAYQRRLLPAKVLPSILFVSRPISSNSFFTRFPLLSSFSRQLMTPSRDQQEDVEQEEEKEKKEKIRSSLFPSLSESTKESSERSASSSFRSSAGGGGARGGEEGSSSREEKTHKTVSKLKDQQEERGMHFGGEKKKKQKEQEKERRRAGEATLLGHERDKGEGGGGEEARESDGDAVAFFQGTPRQGQSHQASRRGVSSFGRDIPSSEVVKKGEKKEGESESDGRDTFLYWFFDRDEDLPLSTAVYRRLRELTEKEKEALLFFHREGGQKEEEEESGEKEEDRRREKRRRKRRKRGRRTRRKEEEERKDEGEKEDERRRSGDQTKEKMRDVSEKRFHITEKEPINTDALGHLTSVPPDKSSSLTSRDLLHSPTDSTQEEEEVKEKKESEEEEDEEEEEETEPLDFPSSSSISQAGGLPFRVSSVPLHILRDAQYLDFTLSHLLLASLLNLQEVQEENYRKMLRVSFGSNRSLRREDMKIHSPYHSELFSSSYLHDRFLLDNDENHRRTTSAFSPSHGLSQERESEEGVEEEKISSSSLGKEKDLRKDERGRFGEREERVDEALIGELARYLYVANPMAYPPPCYDSSSAFSRSRKDDKDSSTASASSDDGMKREKEKNRERKVMKVFFSSSSSDPSNDQTSVVKNKSIANTRSTSSASFFNVSRSSSFFSDRGDVCLDSHSLFSSSLLERLLQPPRALRSVASIDHVLQMLSFYHLEEMPLSSPPHLLHYLAVSSTFRHPLPSSSWPSGVDMLMSTRQEKGEGGEQEEVDIMTEKEEGMSSLSTTSHRNRTSRSLSINSFSRPRATRRALPSPSSKSDLDSFSRHSKMKKGQLPLRSISKEDKAEKIRKDTMEKKGKDEDEKTTMKKTSREKKRDNLNEGEKKEKAPSEIPKNPFSFLGGWIDDEDDETIQSEENTFEASISEEEYRELFTSPLSDSAAIGGGGGESQSISVQTVVDEKSNFLYVFVLYTKDPVYATSKESYPSSSPLSTSIPSASPAYRRRPLRYRTRLAVYRRSLADVLQAALGNMHTRAWLYRHLSNFYPSQNLRLHNHRHSSHRFAKEINQLNSILLSAFIASSSSPSSSPSFSPSSSSSRPVHLRDPVREEETGLRRIHTREGKSGRPSPLHDHRDERNSSSSSRLSSSSSSRKLENFEETRSRSLQRETEEEEQEDFEGGNFLQLESPDALPLYLRGVYSHSAAASSSLSSSSFSHQKREENSARSSMSSQEKKAEEEERHASSSGERSRSPRTSLSPSSLTATPLTPPVSVRREIFSSLSSSSPSSRVPGSFTSVIDSSRHVYSIDSRARILEGFDRLAIASSLLAGEQEEEEVSLAGKTNDTAKNHGDKKTKKREEKEGVRGEEEEEGEETDRVDSKRLILNDVDTWRDLGGCPLPPQMKVISLETVHRAVEYVEGRCVYYTSPEGKELRLKKKKTKKTVARSEEDTSEKRKEERNKEEDGRKKRTDRRDGGGRDGDLHDVNKETFHGEEEVPGEDLSHVHMTGGGIMDQPQETNAALNASSSSHLSSFHSLSSSSSSSLSSSSSPYTFPPGSSSDGSLPPPSLASTVSALYARLSSSVFPPPASLAFVSLHRREMSQALRQILSFPYHPYRMRRALSIFLLSLTRLGGELFLSYSDFAWLLLREGFRCSSSLVRTLWYLVSNPEALYFSMQTSHFSKHRWLNLLPLFEFLHAVYGRGGETKRRAEKKSREGEREEEEDEDEKATSIDDRHLDLSSEGSVKERGEEGRRKDEDDLRSSLKKERRFPRSESTPEVEEEEELPVENEKNGRRHTKKISLTHQETFLSSVSSFFSRFSLLSSLSSLFSPLSRFLQRNVFFFFSSSSFLLFASPSWASPWSIFRLGMSMSFDLLRILWRQQKVFAFRFLEALTAHSFKEKEDELKEEEEREEVDMYRRILRLFERDQEDVHDEEGEEESSFSSSSSSISSSDTYHHEGEEEDPGDGKRHKKKKKSEDLVSEEQEEEQEGIVKFFFSFFGAIFSPFFSSQGVEERKMPMKRPSISGRKKKHNGVDAIASELLFFPHHHHLSVVTPQAMMRAAHLGRAFMHAELTERERSAQIEEEEEERQRQEKEEREEILKRDLHAERDEKQSIPFEKHTSQLLKAHDQERRKEIESLDLSGRRTASSKEEGEEEKIEQRRRRRSDEERRISSEREERQEEERQKLFSSLLSSSSSSSPFSRDAFDEGDLFNLSQPEKILSRIGGGQRGSFEQIERETVQKNSFLSLLDLPWMSFRREEGEEAQELEALIRLKKRRNRRDENNRRRRRGEEEEEAYLTSLGRDDLEAYDEDRGQPRHDYYSIDHHTQGEKEKIGGDRRRRGRGLPIKNQQSYPHSMRSGDRLYENAWIELLSVFSLQVQKVIDIFRVVKAKLSFSSVEGEEEQATKEDDGGEKEEEEEKRDDHGSSAATKKNRMKGSEGAEAEKEEEKERGVEERFPGIIHEKAKSASHGDAEKRNEEESIQEEEIDHDEDDGTAEEEEEKEEESKLLPSSSSPLPHSLESLFSPSSSPSPPVLFSPTSLAMALRGFQLVRSYSIEGEQAWLAVDSETISAAVVYGQPEGLDMKWRVTLFPRVDHTASLVLQRRRRQWFEQYTKEEAKRAEELAKKRKEDKVPFFSSRSEKQVEDAEEGEGRENKRKDEEEKQRKKKKDSERNAEIRRGRRKPLEMKSDKTSPSAELSEVSSHTPLPTTTALALRIGDPVHDEDDEEIHHFSFLSSSLPLSSSLYPSQKEEEHDRSIPAPSYLTHSDEEDEHTPTIQRSHPTRQRRLCHGERTLQPSHTDEASSLRSMQRPSAPHEGRTQNTQTSFSSSSSSLSCEEEREEEEEEEERDSSILSSYEYATFLFEGSAPVDVGGSLSSNGLVFSRGRADKYLFRHSLSLSSLFHLHRKWLRLQKRMRGKAEKSAEVSVEKSEKKKKGDREEEEKRGEKNYDDGDEEEEDEDVDKNLGDKEQQEEVGASLSRKKKFSTHKKRDIDEKIEDMPLPLPLLPTVVGPRVWQRENLGDVALLRHIDLGKSREDVGSPSSSSVTDDEEQAYKSTGMKKHGGILALIVHSNDRAVRYRTFHMTPSIVSSSHPLCPSRKNLLSSLSARRRHGHVRRGASPSSLSRDRRNPTASFHPDSDEKARKRDQNREEEPEKTSHENNDQDEEGCVSWIVGNKEGTDHFVRVLQPGSSTSHTSGQTHSEGGGGGEGRGERTRGRSSGDSHNPRESRGGEGERETSSSSQSGGGGGGEGVYEFVRKPLWCSSRHRRFFAFGYLLKLQSFHLRTRSLTSSSSSSSLRSPLGANEGEAKTSSSGRMKKKKKIEPKSWILREEARQMKAEDADGRTAWRLGNIMGGGWMVGPSTSSSSSPRGRHYQQDDFSDQREEEAERRREREGEEDEKEEDEQDQLSQYEARGVFEEFWRYSPSFRLLSISEDGRYIVGVTGALKVYLQIEDPSASLTAVRTPEETEKNRNGPPFSRRSSHRFSSSVEMNGSTDGKASREGEHDRSTMESEEKNSSDFSPKVREVDVAEALVRAGGDPRNRSIVSVSFFPLHRFIPILDPHLVQQGVIPPPPDRVYLVILLDDGRLLLLYVHPDATLVPTATPFFHHLLFSLSWNNLAMLVYLLVFLLFHLRGQLLIGGGAGGGGGGPGTTNGAGGGGLRQAVWRFWYLMVSLLRIFLSLLLFPLISLLFTLIRALRIILLEIAVLYSHLLQVLLPFPAATNNTPNTNTRNANDTTTPPTPNNPTDNVNGLTTTTTTPAASAASITPPHANTSVNTATTTATSTEEDGENNNNARTNRRGGDQQQEEESPPKSSRSSSRSGNGVEGSSSSSSRSHVRAGGILDEGGRPQQQQEECERNEGGVSRHLSGKGGGESKVFGGQERPATERGGEDEGKSELRDGENDRKKAGMIETLRKERNEIDREEERRDKGGETTKLLEKIQEEEGLSRRRRDLPSKASDNESSERHTSPQAQALSQREGRLGRGVGDRLARGDSCSSSSSSSPSASNPRSVSSMPSTSRSSTTTTATTTTSSRGGRRLRPTRIEERRALLAEAALRRRHTTTSSNCGQSAGGSISGVD